MGINRCFYLFIYDIDKQRTKYSWQDSRWSLRSIGSLVVDDTHDGFPSYENTDREDQEDSEDAEGVVSSLAAGSLHQTENDDSARYKTIIKLTEYSGSLPLPIPSLWILLVSDQMFSEFADCVWVCLCGTELKELTKDLSLNIIKHFIIKSGFSLLHQI